MNQESIDLIQSDCEEVTAGSKHLYLSSLQNQHILITGGTGFLGTWITEVIAFLNRQYNFNIKLTLLSRNANAFHTKAPHLSSQPFITLIDKDVRTILDLPNDVNYIIHAASNPDSREHNLNPLSIIDSITNGTNNVFEKCSRLGNLNKVVNLSSGLVYGKQPADMVSIPETFFGSLDCSQVTSIYAEAKRLSETIGTAYRTQHRLPIVTIRPFTFTGPYQSLDKPWAINNFMQEALTNRPIRILGRGDTERSYMYGSDAAFWILNILANGRVGACYNLGSGEAINMQLLAEKIVSEFSPVLPIISRSGSESEQTMSKFIPDIAFAIKSLNAELTVHLDVAIKRTIQWHRLQQKNN